MDADRRERWERWRGVFEWDGSLCDICVGGTDLSDWQRALDFLRATGYELAFRRDDRACPPPASAREIFSRAHDDAHYSLAIDTTGLDLRCHFFEVDRIELDLDPRTVDSTARLERLLAFLVGLARAIGKPVDLTAEGTPSVVLMRYDPAWGESPPRPGRTQ